MMDLLTLFNTTVAVLLGLFVAIPAWTYNLYTNVSLKENEKRAHTPSQSAVLITGGSRGIGRSIANYLIDQDYVVFVTIRTQSQFDDLENSKTSKGPHPVLLDVTNESHVEPAVQRVQDLLKEHEVELIAVVNNAGINPEGDAYAEKSKAGKPHDNELSDLAVASRVFQTNVMGVARVTKAFLPLLRTVHDSRIINIGSYFGSIAGRLGLSHAYYESAKFALEGLSDTMRRSLAPEGIRVCLVKPGNIVTDMNQLAGEVGPIVVAKEVEHAIAAIKPHSRYYPGKVMGHSVWLLCWVFEVLPTFVVDNL